VRRALLVIVVLGVVVTIWLVPAPRSEPTTTLPVPDVIAPETPVLVESVTNEAQIATLRRALKRARLKLRRTRRLLYVSHVRQRQLGRVLLHTTSVQEAIDLSCVVYGYSCSTLWRKARCETGGTLSPRSYNSSGASGLFQFLGSTWRSTPFARFSVWSPYANALAAGWMHAHGRGGEWVCR